MLHPLPQYLRPEDWILYVLHRGGPAGSDAIEAACAELNARHPTVPAFGDAEAYEEAYRAFAARGFIEGFSADGNMTYQITQRGRLYLLSFYCAPPDPQTLG